MRRDTSCSRPAGSAGRARNIPTSARSSPGSRGEERFAPVRGPSRPIASTGVDIPHGQSAGWLGAAYDPFHLNSDPTAPEFCRRGPRSRPRCLRPHDERSGVCTCPGRTIESLVRRHAHNPFDLTQEDDKVRHEYGRTSFGQSCLLARRLVEAGVRVVTVNMFDTVFNRVTWDCHGAAPFSTLDDYASDLLPTFDQAFTALIDDLERRGRLETTLVVAAGEFGRTPRLNASGGRDHWPGVWSVVLAGGGVRGGQVVGASDAHATAPADRPVTPEDLLPRSITAWASATRVTHRTRWRVVSARRGRRADTRIVR